MKATLASVNVKIADLGAAEKITKRVLSELSREVLEVVCLDDGTDKGMGTEDSRTINELIGVLTPVNRKAAILFFKHFAPFITATNEQGEWQSFGKKDKKNWADKLDAIREFLADPHQNIWTWADRNIEMEQKPYNVAKVTKEIEKALKKANKADVIRAIMAGGLEIADILEVMRPQEQEQPQE